MLSTPPSPGGLHIGQESVRGGVLCDPLRTRTGNVGGGGSLGPASPLEDNVRGCLALSAAAVDVIDVTASCEGRVSNELGVFRGGFIAKLAHALRMQRLTAATRIPEEQVPGVNPGVYVAPLLSPQLRTTV